MDPVRRMLNRLEAGAATCACGGYLSQLDALHRTGIYTSLGYERLKRKNDDIHAIYVASLENWNQTFYTLLLHYLGAPNNSRAFETLASRVPYAVVLRYGRSLRSLEALLLGASGLLGSHCDDEYTLGLKSEFSYLSHKHGITPMSPSEWKTNRIYPHNHPVLRMAQAAAFLSQRNFVMDSILECRTPKDVTALFDVSASEYWLNHFLPAKISADTVKRIGSSKANILGINVVAQLQYAYGSYMNNDRLRDRAITLLEKMPAEINSRIDRWRANGVMPTNAFETQALLQLGNEYCAHERCSECPIGRRIVENVRKAK